MTSHLIFDGWRGCKRYDYLALVYLGLNILLSITDEFGLLDSLVLLLNTLVFGLMIVVRKHRALVL